MTPVVWSLEATTHGLRVRRHGEDPWELVVAEDTQGVRQHQLRLWATGDGRAVVRLPGPTRRPALVTTEEGARYIHPLPMDTNWSSTRCRFHGDGTLTFVEGAGLAPGDCTVVWHTSIDGDEWEPVVGPPGFVAHDVALGGNRLWLAGHWTDESLTERRAGLVLLGLDGEVLDRVDPLEPGRGRLRRTPLAASGSFFGVSVGGPYLVAVRPRLHDDKADVWVRRGDADGIWVHFDDLVAGVAAEADGVAVCRRDGWLATWSAGRRWEERQAFPGPVHDVAWRDGTAAAAVSTSDAGTAVVLVPGGEVLRSADAIVSVALA